MKGSCQIIPLVLYPFEILVSIGQSDKEFQRSIRMNVSPSLQKELLDDKELSFLGTTRGKTHFYPDTGVTVIRMLERTNTPEFYSVLAHEILHAIDQIFRHIGMRLTEASSEAYTYAIQYLTSVIYKEFKLC